MAKFRFDKNFSLSRLSILCKSKAELMEYLYYQLHVKAKDLKVLPNPESDDYAVIMIAPYRENTMIGYVNEPLE